MGREFQQLKKKGKRHKLTAAVRMKGKRKFRGVAKAMSRVHLSKQKRKTAAGPRGRFQVLRKTGFYRSVASTTVHV